MSSPLVEFRTKEEDKKVVGKTLSVSLVVRSNIGGFAGQIDPD
jgi:hypothetical protein